MASQQMERAAELQNPEVRAELNRRVRECERKCFASGRLDLIPQASARARQQTTRVSSGSLAVSRKTLRFAKESA
jgi:hypothetical protein